MEQAVNQFVKGLLCDTHPMMLSNEVLSDALNATITTMNGNEVILQNDMGNRRVDHAYLPNGYVPVGMKEYGGIIYIAAYNPINQRSLIGSFPSPERNIGEEQPGLSNDIENLEFIIDGEKYINEKPILKPLTKDVSLHAGDKFVVYSNFENIDVNNITNYNNTTNNKIISPKNKLYTFALGVLNSQNEFVDITNTLVRWKNTTKQQYTNESLLYQFNDGYFIANAENNGAFLPEGDGKLIKERILAQQVQNANTYSYKLVGPLYLKATINYVLDFSYNIYGTFDKGVATLWIEGTLVYNCSDGVTESLDSGDNDYITYETGTPNSKKFGFDFEIKGKSPENSTKSVLKASSYDKTTNLYTVTMLNEYSYKCSKDDILEYTIDVKANSIWSDYYVKSLQALGTINIGLLGSGTVTLKSFRFLNDYIYSRTKRLIYNLDAYPKYGHTLKDFTLIFRKLQPNNSTSKYYDEKEIRVPGTINNGRNTLSFSWDAYKFDKNSVYEVGFEYIDSFERDELTTLDEYRWFITTELFNDKFDIGGEEDFKNITSAEIIISASSTSDLNLPATSGQYTNSKYFSFDSNFSAVEMEYEKTLPFTLTVSPKIAVVNESLYPSEINNKLAEKENTINSSHFKLENVDLKTDDIIIQTVKKDSTLELSDFISINKNTIGTRVHGNIITKDKFKSPTVKQSNFPIRNLFGSIRNHIIEHFIGGGHYSAVFPYWDEFTGSDDLHQFYIMADYYDLEKANIHTVFEKAKYYKLIDEAYLEAPYIFLFSKYKEAVYSGFNSLDDNIIFTWFCNDNDSCHMVKKMGDWDGQADPNHTKARLWWRGIDNTWCLFYGLIEQGNKNKIAELFNKNIVVCLYKNGSKDTYIPDKNSYIYNSKYSGNVLFNSSVNIDSNVIGKLLEPQIYTWGENKLTFNWTYLSSNVSYQIPISSSDTFLDKVNSITELTELVNVEETGLDIDNNKEDLNPTVIYEKTNGVLRAVNDSIIYMDSSINENYYVPLCKAGEGSPEYIFDHGGADYDSDTYIQYDKVRVFNKEIK